MKQLLQLTLFQLKDKIDMSWMKSKKTLIQSIVFGILKFLLVVAIVFAVLFVLSYVGFISKYQDVLPLFTMFLTVITFLSLCSSTYNLTKSLYLSDDNKVLITLPVNANKLFFSKLFVYFFYELKKSFLLLIPGVFGFLLFETIGFKGRELSALTLLWMIIPIILLVVIQVLLSAVISIPFMYVYRLFKRNQIFDLIVVGVAVTVFIIAVINLINLIPDDIDLDRQWPSMVNGFENFIVAFDKYAYPINLYSRVFFGESSSSGFHYQLVGMTFLKSLIAIGVIGLLTLFTFLLIRPVYFKMIYKTFEFDKNPQLAAKRNVRHKKYITFANKEFKLSFRDFDISGSYIAIYIIIPILLLFMDRVISAISTSMRGDNIAIAVNVLLTILPLLASNSTVATLYSKEGRTAYLTKSNPVNPFIPLTSKLLFNLLFCVPSIVACSIIFANFSGLGVLIAVLFSVSVLLIQYAHIFYSAAQDIMNPQNEVYATTGSDFNNPNEAKATIMAFVGSFIITFVLYFMLVESTTLHGNYISAFVRLLIIAALLFAGFLYLFVKKIQAFYYEK